jgi:fatty-acyl-CoA synthase
MFDGDLLAERARITPDKLALVEIESGARFTYRDLDLRAQAAAVTLREAGVEAGDRYGILAYNCVEFLAFFFAAAKCGAIVVPLSTRATEHELRGIIEDCAMKVLFVGEEFAKLDLPVAMCALRSGEGTCEPLRADAESIYCLLYTSGTTGKPKGVMIPKRQLWWNGYNTAVNWGLREDDVTPIFTPLYHAGGVAAFLIPIFSVGGTIVLHKNFDARVVWPTIERERCTVVLGVPTIWKLLMDDPGFATADLSRVRWFISGGAPLPAYIQQAYLARGVPMKQGYGMTEVGVNCFTMTVEDAAQKPGSIGRPMLFTEVRLIDSDGNEVAEDEIGEMSIRGPHVSSGYWNNEEATRAAYGDEGWFHTGDLARRDADGFFFIAGRRKEMFISGGVNVYPAEIEAELVTHPLVADAAIVPVPDDVWGEVAVAFVVGRAAQHELETYLAARIAKYKLPKRYVFMDVLPRTPYGKVEKAKLREAIH